MFFFVGKPFFGGESTYCYFLVTVYVMHVTGDLKIARFQSTRAFSDPYTRLVRASRRVFCGPCFWSTSRIVMGVFFVTRTSGRHACVRRAWFPHGISFPCWTNGRTMIHFSRNQRRTPGTTDDFFRPAYFPPRRLYSFTIAMLRYALVRVP